MVQVLYIISSLLTPCYSYRLVCYGILRTPGIRRTEVLCVVDVTLNMIDIFHARGAVVLIR